MSWWRYIRERRVLAKTLRVLKKKEQYAVRNSLPFMAQGIRHQIARAQDKLDALDAEYTSTRDA